MPATKAELDERTEHVINTASLLLAACMRMDDWLRETDAYDEMPALLQDRYTDALKRAAGAFGRLKAAQHAR